MKLETLDYSGYHNYLEECTYDFIDFYLFIYIYIYIYIYIHIYIKIKLKLYVAIKNYKDNVK